MLKIDVRAGGQVGDLLQKDSVWTEDLANVDHYFLSKRQQVIVGSSQMTCAYHFLRRKDGVHDRYVRRG